MRNTVLVVVAVAIVAALGYWLMTRGEDAPNPQTAQGEERVETESTMLMETGSYRADTEESTVAWQAGKPAIAGYVHTGQFTLESGDINLTDSELTGEFVVDMNSLEVLSLGGGKAGQESSLEGHLKGDRFFNVSEYPTATFRITDISPKVLPGPDQMNYTATGELTMKGVTEAVSFPVTVNVVSETEVQLTGDLEIDRTRWGIDFGSASVVDQITDNVIGDTVLLSLDIRLIK